MVVSMASIASAGLAVHSTIIATMAIRDQRFSTLHQQLASSAWGFISSFFGTINRHSFVFCVRSWSLTAGLPLYDTWQISTSVPFWMA
jgi:hypothetical protein